MPDMVACSTSVCFGEVVLDKLQHHNLLASPTYAIVSVAQIEVAGSHSVSLDGCAMADCLGFGQRIVVNTRSP